MWLDSIIFECSRKCPYNATLRIQRDSEIGAEFRRVPFPCFPLGATSMYDLLRDGQYCLSYLKAENTWLRPDK